MEKPRHPQDLEELRRSGFFENVLLSWLNSPQPEGDAVKDLIVDRR